MTCETLLQLLNTVEWGNGNGTASERRIVTHMRSCAQCQRGIAQLSEELLARQVLTCDQCRRRFPTYYEATRPEYPLVEMADVEMAEMLLHLNWCASCREEYEELVLLSELEERGEIIEP